MTRGRFSRFKDQEEPESKERIRPTLPKLGADCKTTEYSFPLEWLEEDLF